MNPLVKASPLSRRSLLALATGSLLLAQGSGAHAQDAELPTTASLPESLALALKQGSPLVVMVSLKGCPFCKVARNNYLAPIQGQKGLVIVQLDIRSQRSVVDFKGRTMTQDALIRTWDLQIAPTVLFFGKGGVEVAERLEGGYIPDFYGAYLDERLAQARSKTRL
jgi:thioredoxin-related protein